MWLLNVDTLELEEFIGNNIPPYAILSHTWGSEEVSFSEMKKTKYRKYARLKKGFFKIEGCCAQAKKSGFAWAWYKSSAICYVYLSDVSIGKDVGQMFRKSRWFTRGWTLQELLAPENITFFAQDWSHLGFMGDIYEVGIYAVYYALVTKEPLSQSPPEDLTDIVSEITGVPREFLIPKEKRLDQACVSQRMYWASSRMTTRPEDRAYSLMGLFDVNMPIIYGEGLEKAFARLQQEICNSTPDQSIFAWHHSDLTSYHLLADSPDCFQNSGDVVRLDQNLTPGSASVNIRSAFYLTSLGLRITLPVRTEDIVDNDRRKGRFYATIHCFVKTHIRSRQQLSLSLTYLDADIEGRAIYVCERPNRWIFNDNQGYPESIFIRGISYDTDNTQETLPTSTFKSDYISNSIAAIIGDATINRWISRYENVQDTMTFDKIGVDYLLILTIMKRMRFDLGLMVYTQDFYDHPTIGGFRNHLSSVAHTPGRRVLKEVNDSL